MQVDNLCGDRCELLWRRNNAAILHTTVRPINERCLTPDYQRRLPDTHGTVADAALPGMSDNRTFTAEHRDRDMRIG